MQALDRVTHGEGGGDLCHGEADEVHEEGGDPPVPDDARRATIAEGKAGRGGGGEEGGR